ncbi:exosortase/archaeosortase family protein [Opitutaceae bacterium TAV3]|nr:exosortase/archaeosortase family protein [Opitutaceae bacterium TAV3]
MLDSAKKFSAILSPGFFAALLVAAGFMGFIAWDQSHWWKLKEDYGFGWLVPAFVVFVVYDRWPRIKAAVEACRAPGSLRAKGAGRVVLGSVATLAAVFGALLFFIGAFYRAGAGPSYPGTLAITLGSVGMLFALLFINAPEAKPVTPARMLDDARVQLVALFVFPILVWLVSAPMVSVVENNLSLFLLGRVTAVVFFVFDILGLTIEQQGNVLVLPKGQVGVAEACSGIRSLTGCLFAGSFLAAVFLHKLWKKIALVGCAMLFAFFTNLLRGIFLTAWAYNYGPEAIEGTVHDTAGYAVLGLTVVGLLCLLPLFNLKISFSDAPPPPPPAPPADENHTPGGHGNGNTTSPAGA